MKKNIPELVEVMSVSAVVAVLKALAEMVPRSGGPDLAAVGAGVALAATVDMVEVDSKLATSDAPLSSSSPVGFVDGAALDSNDSTCDGFKSSS